MADVASESFQYPAGDNSQFGNIGSYIESVETYIASFNYTAVFTQDERGRWICPEDKGGCGHPGLKRTEEVWLENSKGGIASNDLGEKVRPPRRPSMRRSAPEKPAEFKSPAPPDHSEARNNYRFSISELKRTVAIYSAQALLLSLPASAGLAALFDSAGANDAVVYSVLAVGIIAHIVVTVLIYLYKAAEFERWRNERIKTEKAEHQKAVKEAQAEANRNLETYKFGHWAFEESQRNHVRAIKRYEKLKELWEKSLYCPRCGSRWHDLEIGKGDLAI